jgi:hypothetical protein
VFWSVLSVIVGYTRSGVSSSAVGSPTLHTFEKERVLLSSLKKNVE